MQTQYVEETGYLFSINSNVLVSGLAVNEVGEEMPSPYISFLAEDKDTHSIDSVGNLTIRNGLSFDISVLFAGEVYKTVTINPTRLDSYHQLDCGAEITITPELVGNGLIYGVSDDNYPLMIKQIVSSTTTNKVSILYQWVGYISETNSPSYLKDGLVRIEVGGGVYDSLPIITSTATDILVEFESSELNQLLNSSGSYLANIIFFGTNIVFKYD